MRLASPERDCLDLAHRAASVDCVARAAHAALIERQRGVAKEPYFSSRCNTRGAGHSLWRDANVHTREPAQSG